MDRKLNLINTCTFYSVKILVHVHFHDLKQVINQCKVTSIVLPFETFLLYLAFGKNGTKIYCEYSNMWS